MLDIDKILKETEDIAMNQIRTVLSHATNIAIDSTPSESGNLKGQWQVVKKGSPMSERPDDASGARTKISAQSALDAMTIEDNITIGNNAPYARIVNDGTNKRRGSHMEEKAASFIRRAL